MRLLLVPGLGQSDLACPHARASHSESKLHRTYGSEKVKLDRIVLDKEEALQDASELVERREVRSATYPVSPPPGQLTLLFRGVGQAELGKADAVAAEKGARADVAKARMQALRERFDNYVGALRTAEASFHAASRRHSANMAELQQTVATFDQVMQALQGGPSVVRKTPVPRQHVGPRRPAAKVAQSSTVQADADERAIDEMVSEVGQLVAEREAMPKSDLEQAPREAIPVEGKGSFHMPTGATGTTGATGIGGSGHASGAEIEEELEERFVAGGNRVAEVRRVQQNTVHQQPSPEADMEPALVALYQEVRAHARGERVYQCPKGYCVRATLALEEYGNTMECFNADVPEDEATKPAQPISAEAGPSRHSSETVAPLCGELLREAESVQEQAAAKDMSPAEYGEAMEKVVGASSAALLTGSDGEAKPFASHDDMLLYATRAVALAKAQMQDRAAEWHDSMLKLHQYRETVMPILQDMMKSYRRINRVYVEELQPKVEDAQGVVEARQKEVKAAEQLQLQAERDLRTATDTINRVNRLYEAQMEAITGRKERVRDQLLLSSEAQKAFQANTASVNRMLAKYFGTRQVSGTGGADATA